jgi:hypothetical protein
MNITSLDKNEVFVFGSNSTGFHGAGSAGYACRGTAENTWRNDSWFLKAMKSPIDSPDRIGKWAVYGAARGLQEGKEGKSYAIETVKTPGKLKSTTRREIYSQLVELWNFAKCNTRLMFYITPLGQGYAGYSKEEMKEVWDFLFEKHGHPENIKLLFTPGTNIEKSNT